MDTNDCTQTDNTDQDKIEPAEGLPAVSNSLNVPFEHRVFTKREVAAFFQVTIRTVESWMAKRLISYRKLGGTIRITGADIHEALEIHLKPRVR